MAGSGMYTIKVNGILDDSKIRAQLAALESQINNGGLGAVAGTGRNSRRRTQTVYGQAGREAQRASRQVQGFATQTRRASLNLLDVGKKVLAFGAVTSAIQLATSGIGSMVNNVVELDAQLTEFKKVSDLSGQALETYTSKAYKAGEATAKTGVQMLEAATEFRKMGYTDDASLTLAKTATTFQNIADTEISAGDAAKFINSQMKAFNFTAEDSVDIIDKVNQVANRNAVGTNDLQLALTKAGSAMGTLGNSYESTIGLVTSGTEIMVGQASKVGRGLRTIGINIGAMAEETDTWTAANGKVNVSLKDSEGNLRSTYDIMKDMYEGVEGQSVAWDKLSESEQNAIATQAAGRVVLARTGLIDWELLKIYTPNYNSNILVA